MPGETTIDHRPGQGRFVATIDGAEAGECVYRRDGARMQIVHTEVDPALQGRGIAAALVDAAVAHAREQRWQVVPLCSYVRAWLRRHPEAAEVLAPR